MNVLSFFCSERGIARSVGVKDLEIVGFTSSLGFGGNGLFGLEGAAICCCAGSLSRKVFWLLD